MKKLSAFVLLASILFIAACDNVPYYPAPGGGDSCQGGGCQFKRTPADFPVK